MTDTETPQYLHDCDSCIFLGRFEADYDYDLYYCGGNGWPTVVGRRSDDGSDYISGMIFAEQGHSPALVEARKRAIAMGFDVVGKRKPVTADKGEF